MNEQISLIEEKNLAETFSTTKIKSYFKNYFYSLIPSIYYWFPNYERGFIIYDIFAGLTAGVLVLPQGLAYAAIAEMPPVYGLYAALIPSLVYFFMGSCKELIIGPTTIISLMVGNFVLSLGYKNDDDHNKINAVMAMSFIIGVTYILMSLLNISFLINLLSKPIVSGFTSAASFLIAGSQMKGFFGSPIGRAETIQDTIKQVIEHIHQTNVWAVLMATVCIIVVISWRQITHPVFKIVPSALILVILGTLISWIADLNKKVNLQIVGVIPQGLYVPSWPFSDFATFVRILPNSLLISLVALVETISIGKSFSDKEGYSLSLNVEFFGLGLAQIFGSFFGAYPVSGSFSRTAVNYANGCKSQFSHLLGVTLVFLTLLFMTPLFHYLPLSVLAGIIIGSVTQLFDYNMVPYLWRTKKRDLLVWFGSFFATLFIGIDQGILIALVISLFTTVVSMNWPDIQVEKVNNERNETTIVVVRMMESLFFISTDALRNKITELVKENNYSFLILDFSSVNNIDTTGLQALLSIQRELKDNRIDLVMVKVNSTVRSVLSNSSLETLGVKFWDSLDSAIVFYGNQNVLSLSVN